MILHQACRLQVSVYSDGSGEPEARSAAHGADLITQLGAGRHGCLVPAPAPHRRTRDAPPEPIAERAVIVLYAQVRTGIRAGSRKLLPVADDGRICQQSIKLAVSPARHNRSIEPAERSAEGFTPAQDEPPAQCCLERFKHEKFEQFLIVPQRDAPLLVMISAVQVIARGHPATAGQSISKHATTLAAPDSGVN